MLEVYAPMLFAWLEVRLREVTRQPDRGEGIVTTVVMIVGFVLIALAALAIFKTKVLDASNGVQTQNP